MATALVTHPDGFLHLTPHPVHERVARLDSVLRAVGDLPLVHYEAPMAQVDDLCVLHDHTYVQHVLGSCPEAGFTFLDTDTDNETCLSPTSRNALLRAAGGAMKAVDLVMSAEVETAFVAMRPPGHHALPDAVMGFCFFGNVALAAKHALSAHDARLVAIVDIDVHHGNGTQALVQDDPRILFISSQQMPLWPGSGDATDIGPHGTVLNIPLSPGTSGGDMRDLYAAQALPRLRAFSPDLILISAGFDAHRDDPLAELNWVEADYDWITRNICAIARETCSGRVVSVLEGGYHLDALGQSARAHVQALLNPTG